MTTQCALPAHAAEAETLEAFCCSGSSPTVHLLGAGKVGQAFLELLAATPLRLVALTDSTATVHRRAGLSGRELSDLKRRGGSVADRRGAESLPVPLAIDLVGADVVVDVTPSGPSAAQAALYRCRTVLRRGTRLVLAAKDAVALAPGELLGDEYRERIGIHAVLGGTGRALCDELAELRASCSAVAAVGNATTTAIVEAIEAGDSVEGAIARAQERGLLEADPTLDLDGTDAVTKLRIVAGALWGVGPTGVLAVETRQLDPDLLRWRPRRGRTTRLVARATRAGAFRLAFEEVDRGSPLAVPSDRVAYCYDIDGDRRRVHIGHGLGPVGTAQALLEDLTALTVAGGAR